MYKVSRTTWLMLGMLAQVQDRSPTFRPLPLNKSSKGIALTGRGSLPFSWVLLTCMSLRQVSFCSSVSIRTISRDKLRTWFLSERPSPFSSSASSSPSTYHSQRKTTLRSCQAHTTLHDGRDNPLPWLWEPGEASSKQSAHVEKKPGFNLTQCGWVSFIWPIMGVFLDLKSHRRAHCSHQFCLYWGQRAASCTHTCNRQEFPDSTIHFP